MDTTKDIVDTHQNEEENNVDVATEQPNVNNNNTSNISSGLQQIEDDNEGLPLPMGMAEVISNRAEPPKQIGKVEQLDDDDNGPEPPAAMLEASLNAADPDINNKISETISNNLSSINELSPPVPFNSATFETQDAFAKKIAKDEIMNQKPAAASSAPPSDIDSIYEPSREIIEGGEDIPDNTNTGRGDTNRRGWEDIGIGSSNNARDIESQTRIVNNDEAGGGINDAIVDTDSNEVPTLTNQAALGDTAEIHIPEAFLVEDVEEEVFIATPTLPWWKQRRTKILIGVVSILLGAMAIALGVSLSQSNNPEPVSSNSTILFVTPPPTISIAPSSSMAPSTSPPTITYECFGADDGGKDGILYDAVRSYFRQECAVNKACGIGQTYGWPMNSWCVDNVKDMSYLLEYMDTFNEDINGWNTSSVTDMRYMFYDSTSFNGDVSNFDTSSVTNMNHMFWGATAFNQDLSNFDTSSVTNMWSMFNGATSFNGDVSNFDTSSVTDISFMFNGATSFNQDLSNFDTSRVTSMWSMFNGATAFNQDVSSWSILNVTDMRFSFYDEPDPSAKIYAHGKPVFHTSEQVISLPTLAAHFKVHPKLLRMDRFVLLIADLPQA